MPAPRNPFPGMDPFFQDGWGNVHVFMLSGISDGLNEGLPSDLVARIEGRTADAANADVEAEEEHWLEIREARGRVITVIEVLCPANKSEEGWPVYRERQQSFLAAGVNLVEIDLIRGGRHVVGAPLGTFSSSPGTSSLVCVAGLQLGRRDVYSCPLREPLPSIAVPLRAGEPDMRVALQPLIDECYRVGRYWLTDGARDLEPPLSAEDAAWVQQRLQDAGLRRS